eukprot:jgi/Mesvir1/13415/Mv16496-RA.2
MGYPLKCAPARQIRRSYPDNLVTLLAKCMLLLDALAADGRDLPTITPSVGTVKHAVRRSRMNPGDLNQALNAVRILTRIVPLMLEVADPVSKAQAAADGGWVQELMWWKDFDLSKARRRGQASHLAEIAKFQNAANLSAQPAVPSPGDSGQSGRDKGSGPTMGASPDARLATSSSPGAGAAAPATMSPSEAPLPSPAGSREGDAAPGQGAVDLADGASSVSTAATGGQPSPSPAASTPVPHVGDYRPLGYWLVDLTLRLLFTENLTLPPGGGVLEGPDASSGMIWAPGILCDRALTASNKMLLMRAEVLRLLMALLSEGMFILPNAYQTTEKMFLRVLTSPESLIPNVPELTLSLLNTITNHYPSSWDISVSQSSEEILVEVSLQVLLVLIDYAPLELQDAHLAPPASTGETSYAYEHIRSRNRGSHDTERAPAAPQGHPGPEPELNMFQAILAAVRREEDLTRVFLGMTRLLRCCVPELCGSRRMLTCYQELVMLLWKLISCNKHLLALTCAHASITELMDALLALIYRCRADVARLAMLHLGMFILLELSGDRKFSIHLNKPVSAGLMTALSLPSRTMSYMDALIHTLYKVIFNGGDAVKPVYGSLLTVLCNVGAYCKALAHQTAEQLVAMLELFARPSTLYAGPHNYEHLKYLLTAINSILQYQSDGNVYLVYSLLRRRASLRHLARLTKPGVTITEVMEDVRSSLEGEIAAVTAGVPVGSPAGPETVIGPLEFVGENGVDAPAPAANPPPTGESAGSQMPNQSPTPGHAGPDSISPAGEVRSLAREAGESSFPPPVRLAAAPQGTGVGPVAMPIVGPASDQPDDSVTAAEATGGSSGEDTLEGRTIPTLWGGPVVDSEQSALGRRSRELASATAEVSRPPADGNAGAPGSMATGSKVSGSAVSGSATSGSAASAVAVETHPQPLPAPALAPVEAPERVVHNEEVHSQLQALISGLRRARLSRADEASASVWQPSQEWLDSVLLPELPLHSLVCILGTLGAEVDAHFRHRWPASSEDIVAFLSRTTLVGLLPMPQPVVVHRFVPNKFTDLWLSAQIFGTIYLRQQVMDLPGFLPGETVKLFKVSYRSA